MPEVARFVDSVVEPDDCFESLADELVPNLKAFTKCASRVQAPREPKYGDEGRSESDTREREAVAI